MKRITDIRQAYGLDGATVYRDSSCEYYRLAEYWSGRYDAALLNEDLEEVESCLLTPSDLIGAYIVETVEWWVRYKSSGNLIERVYSLEEGQDIIMEYEEHDKEIEIYQDDRYEVAKIPRRM